MQLYNIIIKQLSIQRSLKCIFIFIKRVLIFVYLLLNGKNCSSLPLIIEKLDIQTAKYSASELLSFLLSKFSFHIFYHENIIKRLLLLI